MRLFDSLKVFRSRFYALIQANTFIFLEKSKFDEV